MRGAWVVGLLVLGGCFNFDQAATACRQSGRCAGGDGGAGDAGVPDGGTSYAPFLETTTGWTWDYPRTSGASLYQLAVYGDDEVWAGGEDDLLLHYLHGTWTGSHLPAPSTPPWSVSCLLELPDAGLYAFDSSHTAYVPKAGGGFAGTTQAGAEYLEAVNCTLGADGVPLLVGKRHDDVNQLYGPAIERGVSSPSVVWFEPAASNAGFALAADPSGVALAYPHRVLGRAPDGGWSVAAELGTGYYPSAGILRVDPATAWVSGTGGGSFSVPLDGGALTALTLPEPSTGLNGCWSSLARDGPDVVAAGGPGVARCVATDPGQCSLEYADSQTTLFRIARGPTALFAVGLSGQVLRKPADAGWEVLAPGARLHLDALFQDTDGTLWAGGDGWLLHRTAEGWVERQLSFRGRIHAITRTFDGKLWVAADEAFVSVDDTSDSPVALTLPGGGIETVNTGSGRFVFGLTGSASGNTWVVGTRGLLAGYDGTGWTEVAVPTTVHFTDVFVSDGGTAWAVSSFGSQRVYFFDGSAWRDVTPAGATTSDLTGVWGPGPREVYVTASTGPGFHFLPDGGAQSWSIGGAGSGGLTGRVRPDGGVELWGLAGETVEYLATPLASPLHLKTSVAVGFANRVRVFDGRVWVTGPRGGYQPTGYVLSLDAGR